MDSYTAPHRYCHLVGISPSMSPPPFGERNIQPRQTLSHFDSHTMGGHEPKILKIPDLRRHVWEYEPMSTYGTQVGSGCHLVGLSYEYFS